MDGIPPKLLMETVEQMQECSTSLKEGVVPFEWKEANSIYYLKGFEK